MLLPKRYDNKKKVPILWDFKNGNLKDGEKGKDCKRVSSYYNRFFSLHVSMTVQSLCLTSSVKRLYCIQKNTKKLKKVLENENKFVILREL